MNVAHFAEAMLAATILSSFTDWFFFGVLFHSRYQAYPEVWRSEFSGDKEWKAILMATVLSIIHGGHVPVPRARAWGYTAFSARSSLLSRFG